MLPWLETRGVTVVRARGAVAGARRVQVGDDVLVARRAVVLATGSDPFLPPVPGLAEARPWTNRQGTTASAAPVRLAVVGGGPVAVELALAWAGLGSRVTLLERGNRLLAREEPFAGEQVREGLVRAGVDVRLGVEAAAVSRNGNVRVELAGGGGVVEADEVLVATGRRPRTEGIGLESVGIDGGGYLEVDESLRVPGHGWLFAVGDVNGRALLTHMGKYQARLAADAILGEDVRLRSDGGRSPRVVFSDPQVGAVGHTLASAEEAGLRVRAVDVDTGGNAGGSFVGKDAVGTSRLVVDEDARVVAGATFTGPEIAEALHAATIAVVARVPLDDLWHAVPAFPTRSEAWLRLLETYGL
ncbi:MAG TPA: NAD(P)/FAD-dependent oxidoreductase, partial [Gaiellaceae bacterium]|nr:NAD(P)/FAD-dependent oxidoreductase [Gaiellaceae bacterium]